MRSPADGMGHSKRQRQYAPASSTHPSEEDTKEHPLSVADRYNDKGLLLDEQGNYKEAIEHLVSTLQLRTKALGKNQPSIADRYYNLGLVYYRQGNYEEALKHHEVGLRIWQAAPGKYPEQEAKCHNNLGSIYQKQGNYSKALIRTQEAASSSNLPIKRSWTNQTHGSEHYKRQKKARATAQGSAPYDAALATQHTLASFTYPPAAIRYGFKAKHIAADGNCLFRAVADQIEHQLKIYFDREVTPYKVLRHIAANHIASNVGLYKPFTDEQTVAAVEELMSNMAQDEEWAGDEALVILSRALQITIVVIKDDARSVPIYKPIHSQGTIYLYYKDRSHYESLYRDGAHGVSEYIESLDRLLQSVATDSSFIPEKQIVLAELFEDTADALAQESMYYEPAPLPH
ncbi:MAG: tetratricopeptide repeat protein, partial [Bacteroidota bacterium]